jgi:transcriptional regulator with XRE-family HTH domain
MAVVHEGNGSRVVEKIDLSAMGRRIRIERARLDISQQELATRAKAQQKTIAQIERGKQRGISFATLVAIANALDNLSIDYLMFGQEVRRKGIEE